VDTDICGSGADSISADPPTTDIIGDDCEVIDIPGAPDTAIDGGPEDLTRNARPTFTFSSTEPASTFECSIDDADFAPCDSPFTPLALGDGQHTFAVRATDSFGETDATPATRIFTIDATAPDTKITKGPKRSSTDRTPTFEFTSTEPNSTFVCSIDGRKYAACATPLTLKRQAKGSHTFAVRARDEAGNLDPKPATRSYSIK
ncbi:MAG: large repetitive protein, partial [Solirubrobacterales bacterium]|nr:large repetitive protein [Solirubrobacterales bacterium]